MNRNKFFHSIAVITAGILWGSMGIFVRVLNIAGLSPMEIVGTRAIGTVMIYLVYLGLFKREAFRIRLKDIWCFVGTGIFSFVFFNYCYCTTILLADLSVAAVLLYTAPSIVIVLSAFLFKEKMTKWRVAALLMAFAGSVLVTGIAGGNVNLSLAGLFTGLGAGFGYALYTIFGRFALEKGYSSLTINFYTFVMAIIGVTPFIHWGNIPKGMHRVSGGIFIFASYVFFTTFLAYLLYTWGMREVENGIAAILATVEPVVATIIGVLVFHEGMTALEFVGIALVVASVALCNRQ